MMHSYQYKTLSAKKKKNAQSQQVLELLQDYANYVESIQHVCG